jgi:DNA-binding MarR family transcriptional regulator
MEVAVTLTDKQRKFYEDAHKQTDEEIKEIDTQIEEELAKVKERLASLQEAKKAALQMHSAACMRLGLKNEYEEESE